MMQHSELVYVKKVRGKGRGVFARTAISRGTVIERIPVVVVPVKYIADGWKNPALSRYFFVRDHNNVALALGYGSLYNHSFNPNAQYEDAYPLAMVFRAIRDIEKDEEITVNYNGDPKDKEPVGFDVVE